MTELALSMQLQLLVRSEVAGAEQAFAVSKARAEEVAVPANAISMGVRLSLRQRPQ